MYERIDWIFKLKLNTKLMKKQLLLLALGASISFTSCRVNELRGEGAKGSNSPSVASFAYVDIDLPVKADIVVQEGAQTSVTFDGYKNVLEHVKVKVEGNKMRIYTDLDETWEIDCDEVVAHITVPSLAGLSLSGAPDADIHGNIRGREFNLDISGSSTVVIDNINVEQFKSDVSGAGEIRVKGGNVRVADYEISGAGKIVAFPLQTEQTSASISGAGKSEVSASHKLMASISGAGTVKYKGHPAVTKDVSGVGSVSDAN